MSSIPYNKILQFNSNTRQAVRKEFGLDKPERLEEAINILDNWIKKQDHIIKKDFNREYLEVTLVTSKGLLERAKQRIDKLCTLKSLMPDYFQNIDDTSFMDISHLIYHGHLPKLTSDHYRVYAMKVISDDFEPADILKYYKYTVTVSEYLKKNDYCSGFLIVIDCRDINPMKLATKINPIDLRRILTLLMDGYGMRIKGIHLITPSKMVDVFVTLFKQVLSTKVGGRILVHKAIEDLYDSVPREILPAEFGGDAISLKKLNETWIDELSSSEFINYLIEMNKATTDESRRQTDKFNETYLGVPGSFRTLTVD